MKTDRCPYCHQIKRRSNPQNRLYWELLRLISEKLGYTPETWHEYFKRTYLPMREVEMPDWTTVLLPTSTSDLNVEEFGEYFLKVERWAAEHEIYLQEYA